MKAAVRVDPRLNPLYGGYYVCGLRERFEAASIAFAALAPSGFERRGVAFEVRSPALRAYIDPGDDDGFDEAALRWCDVYAKVSLNPERPAPFDRDKVMAAGPGFGVRAWSSFGALDLLCRDLAAGPAARCEPSRFAMWRAHFERLGLDAYRPRPSDDKYVFSLSSTWAPEDACNRERAEFVRAARAVPGVRFEGGFAPPSRADVPETRDLTVARRSPLPEYLEKTARSTVVLNTPAVLDCHGWKLGEFLALGKAIVSTPLSRDLPAPLEHGVHLHVVAPERASMKAAIAKVCGDPAYRQRLEANAREYFVRYLAPGAVVDRILQRGSFRRARA